MATTAGQGEGKTAFVRDCLQRDSSANERSINKAWKAVGNEGTISGTLVSKIRREMGLTGTRRSADGSGAGEAAAVQPKPESPSKGPKATRATKSVEAATVKSDGQGAPPKPEVRSEAAQTEDKDQVLDEVEEGIDDLIFRLKGLGGRPEVLEALRRARRLLYQGPQ
ncbi:MAG TPA: hypothetical protein VKP69_23160 [Isosphaeraceae bacterium]|nr:hypothetical protein [Isosphaeraceae bacterium]